MAYNECLGTKRELVFASGNKDKLLEVRALFKDLDINIISPSDCGIDDFDVDEDQDSLEGNAQKKAMSLYELIGKPVFADDTGLFVAYLDGEPGVYSARYSGEGATYESNRKKLLANLDGIKDENRAAYFKTVIAFVSIDGDISLFEGRVDGLICEEERGKNGFGYDSVFYVSESQKCFAEMDMDEKSKISHRGRALEKLKTFLSDRL